MGAVPEARKAARPLAIFLATLLMGAALHSTPNPSPQTAAANKDYALIFGTVWGPDSRPVAGIPIKIRRASEKKFRWELVSNHTGEFSQRVPLGAQDYVIEADIKTAKGTPKPEITVHIDDNERQDVGIHLTEQQLASR